MMFSLTMSPLAAEETKLNEDDSDVLVAIFSNATTNSTKARCAPFPDRPHLCTDVANVRRSVAVVSLTGCLLVIFLIWLLRKYERSPAQRIILWLTVSATVHSIGGSLSDPDTHPDSVRCQVQAFVIQFGVWAIMLWIACIAVNVAWNVLGVKRSVAMVSHEKAYHITCWTLAVLMSTIPFAFGAYGHTGGWCWITGKYKELRFAIYYIPLYIILAGIVVLYALIARKLRRMSLRLSSNANSGTAGDQDNEPFASRDSHRSTEQRRASSDRSLFAYPIVFFALAAFPLINRVYQAARGEGKAVFALSVLHAISIQIMGLVNTVLYGLKKENLLEIKKHGFIPLLKARLGSKRALRSSLIQVEMTGRGPVTRENCVPSAKSTAF